MTTSSVALFLHIMGDYAPRYYRLTGDDYAKLVAAIQALPYRRLGIYEGAWHIDQQGLQTLSAQGYTLEQEADFRFVNPAHSILETVDAHTKKVLVTFEYRNRNGEWAFLENKMIRFHTLPDQDVKQVAAEQVACYGASIVTVWETLVGEQRSEEVVMDALALIRQRIRQTGRLHLPA